MGSKFFQNPSITRIDSNFNNTGTQVARYRGLVATYSYCVFLLHINLGGKFGVGPWYWKCRILCFI